MIKNCFRILFNFLHLDVTKNLHYDRLTKAIIKKALSSNANTIDVGCHKGEILCEFAKKAPQGIHFGFEPIPEFYEKLKIDFKDRATIYPYALAENNGTTTFHYVKNAPAYSGIKKRNYKINNPNIEKIEVEVRKLDEIIPSSVAIDFIKIDVEGAEFDVLKGAELLLKKNKPLVIFECGLGASEYYNTDALAVFDFFNTNIHYEIYTLANWLAKKSPLSNDEFITCFNTNAEYYFIAEAKK